tara:strand:+ start:1316 stop:1537 length:222 start_codon:yes stop_codon:yes gene_type:complete
MAKKVTLKEVKFVTISNEEGLADNILETCRLGKLELLSEFELDGKTYGLILNKLSFITVKIPKLNYELYKKEK